jgi:hypothetical protein
VKAVLSGERFDVALVRAHCERLLAESERRALDRVVFEDWTRDRGMGPDNREPGAFVLSDEEVSIALTPGLRRGRGMRSKSTMTLTELRRRRLGGWPGRLAREFGSERCSGCDGRGLARTSNYDCRVCSGRGGRWDTEAIDQWYPCGPCDGSGNGLVRCYPCKGRCRVRKPGITPGFAAGPGIARTAQRLLDTLDGRCPWAPDAGYQPSECPTCCGPTTPNGTTFATADGGVLTKRPGHRVGFVTQEGLRVIGRDGGERRAQLGEAVITMCNDCRGTGHSLAGVLPPVEERQKARTFEARLSRDIAGGHRVGQAARGDGLDCTHCQGRGLGRHGLCRFCDGAGRLE